MKKPVYLIAAMAQNRVIGKGDKLPWSIREDWRYFLDKTSEGVLIIGRKSFESFKKASERNVVVVSTRKEGFPGAEHAGSVEEALTKAHAMPVDGPIWICGGVRIYEETLPVGDKLYLTHVEAEVEGDTYFPADWQAHYPVLENERTSESGGYKLRFCVYRRS